MEQLSEEFSFVEYEDGYELEKYRGTSEVVHIPERYQHKWIRSIGTHAIFGNPHLKTIHFPRGLTNIADHSCMYCQEMTTLHFPEGLQKIGESAFAQSLSLQELHFPKGLVSIGVEAFTMCESLTSITFAGGPRKIEDGAFSKCISLERVEFAAGLMEIKEAAFAECESLQRVDLPDGVRVIEDYAFAYCVSMTTLRLPPGLKSIRDYAFYGCESLLDIEWPESVYDLGEQVFYGCTNATLHVPRGGEAGVPYVADKMTVAIQAGSFSYKVFFTNKLVNLSLDHPQRLAQHDQNILAHKNPQMKIRAMLMRLSSPYLLAAEVRDKFAGYLRKHWHKLDDPRFLQQIGPKWYVWFFVNGLVTSSTLDAFIAYAREHEEGEALEFFLNVRSGGSNVDP